jgi:hypothetical protein
LRVWSTWRWHTWVYGLWRRSRSNSCSKQNVTIRYSGSKTLKCDNAKPLNIVFLTIQQYGCMLRK